jgi:hypothetical protein
MSTVDPASLGLSETTINELRELIDGGPSPPASSGSPGEASTPAGGARPRTSMPAPAPVPVPQPVADVQHDPNISSQHGYPSPPPEAGGAGKHVPTAYSTTTAAFDADSSAPGSPSSSGFGVPRSRIVNPNNPFRRSMGEHH